MNSLQAAKAETARPMKNEKRKIAPDWKRGRGVSFSPERLAWISQRTSKLPYVRGLSDYINRLVDADEAAEILDCNGFPRVAALMERSTEKRTEAEQAAAVRRSLRQNPPGNNKAPP